MRLSGIGHNLSARRRPDQNGRFADFFNAHRAGVERYARLLVGPQLQAHEDICIDVFVVALKRFEALQLWELPPSVARGWLLRVTWNRCAKEHRSRMRRDRAYERLDAGVKAADYDPFDELFLELLVYDGSLEARARQVIAGLNAMHRTVLELELEGPPSGEQLAVVLGVTHQAARLHRMRAKRAFAVEFTNRFGSPWGEANPE